MWVGISHLWPTCAAVEFAQVEGPGWSSVLPGPAWLSGVWISGKGSEGAGALCGAAVHLSRWGRRALCWRVTVACLVFGGPDFQLMCSLLTVSPSAQSVHPGPLRECRHTSCLPAPTCSPVLALPSQPPATSI